MHSTNTRYLSGRRYPIHSRRFRLRVSSSRLRQIVVRLISFGVILTLVVNTAPAAPVSIAAMARDYSVSLKFWAGAGGLASMLDMNRDGNPLEDILRMAGKGLR